MSVSFDNPYRVLKLSTLLLGGGLAMLMVGILLAYRFEADLPLSAVLAAHLMTILGPTAIKIGYVLRLLALRRLSVHPRSRTK
ncbi:transmembrane sensor/regulator PpyR [Pseudomonas sp. CrR25]|nr:transmembrane sensor/regulator PpyR [Pseudomonas sp. CrR25]